MIQSTGSVKVDEIARREWQLRLDAIFNWRPTATQRTHLFTLRGLFEIFEALIPPSMRLWDLFVWVARHDASFPSCKLQKTHISYVKITFCCEFSIGNWFFCLLDYVIRRLSEIEGHTVSDFAMRGCYSKPPWFFLSILLFCNIYAAY